MGKTDKNCGFVYKIPGGVLCGRLLILQEMLMKKQIMERGGEMGWEERDSTWVGEASPLRCPRPAT
jgi:hypothetical protein